MRSRALWHTSPTTSEVQSAELPALVPGQCLVEGQYSLVSTGTERLVATGGVPASLYADMRVPYQAGELSLPVKYGYSLVGRVKEGSSDLIGQTVHLLHPHQDICVVQEADVFVVPKAIPSLRATLASNLETALTALWDARVTVGDRVAVVGFGMIGALVARLLQRLLAVSLQIYEIDPLRLAQAERLGFVVAHNPPRDLDTAFHTSGSAAGLQTSIDAVGPAGKIIELSWYGNRAVSVRLGESFHRQRKRIIGSQVSSLPASHLVRWDFRRRKEVVFELLRDDAFDAYITEVVLLSQTPNLFDRIRQGDRSPLGQAVQY